jgi:hypothetical protein
MPSHSRGNAVASNLADELGQRPGIGINTEPKETQMKSNANSPFGEVVFAYTRRQAIADGIQVDVTTTARQAGITFPMFLTRAVFDAHVAVPEGVTGQYEAGRLWDIVWLTRFGILRARPGVDRIPVALYIRNDDRAARLVKLIAICGPMDIDDPQPAITVMLPDED